MSRSVRVSVVDIQTTEVQRRTRSTYTKVRGDASNGDNSGTTTESARSYGVNVRESGNSLTMELRNGDGI